MGLERRCRIQLVIIRVWDCLNSVQLDWIAQSDVQRYRQAMSLSLRTVQQRLD